MKWVNQFLNYVLFFTGAICVAIFGYVYFKNLESVNIKTPVATTQQSLSAEELANKYMKQMSTNLQKQQLESITKIKSTTVPVVKVNNTIKEVQPADIPIDQQIAKDSMSDYNQILTENYSQKSYELQMSRLQNDQARKEYAAEFIANARKSGYHITLSENLEVTSVEPIRKPTNQSNDNDTFESEPSN